MPGLLFNNIWMLAGLSALSVPVIIHLLLRRKKKRLRFSTIQFFVRQDEQSSQRRKLRNWLLLSLRLLICAFLVLAFARPYLDQKPGAAVGQGKRQVVILLDRSLSMQSNASDGPKWAKAREAARQILSELKPDDRAALVSCAGQAEVLSEWAPGVAVSKLLNDLQPTVSTANLGEGLQQAARLLAMSDPKATTTIYVVSDLQRSGCLDLTAHPISRETDVKSVKVGDLLTPNFAVTDLQLDGNDWLKSRATVSSFSDEDSPEVKLDVSVDGKVLVTAAMPLSAGASTNLELSIPTLKPGWHNVSVQIKGRDPLSLDDARFQTVFIPEPARVLVADGRQGGRSYEGESFFVTAALDPGGDSTNGFHSDFVCQRVSPEELASKLTVRPGRLPCDLVVLPALKEVPAALGTALSTYLQAGGGLLVFLGDGISANKYHAEFRDWLPVRLGNPEMGLDKDLGWRIGDYDTNTPMFSPFQQPNSGKLSLAHFTKRFTLSPEDTSLVAAKFEDGAPLLVTRSVGRGRVAVVNTSSDTSWNDWPKHKSFVPWLYGTGHYLTRAEDRQQVAAPSSAVAGGQTDVDLGRAAAKASFILRPPGGKELTLKADDQGALRDVRLDTPGVYSVRDSQGMEVRRLAVNVPPEESDLASLSANDFQQDLARTPDARQTTLAAGLFGTGSNQRELWRVLLLTVLGLLFLELLIANRTLA